MSGLGLNTADLRSAEAGLLLLLELPRLLLLRLAALPLLLLKFAALRDWLVNAVPLRLVS